ncbi:hypothetical protein Dimus_000489, partial [Dionaea muscipula]
VEGGDVDAGSGEMMLGSSIVNVSSGLVTRVDGEMGLNSMGPSWVVMDAEDELISTFPPLLLSSIDMINALYRGKQEGLDQGSDTMKIFEKVSLLLVFNEGDFFSGVCSFFFVVPLLQVSVTCFFAEDLKLNFEGAGASLIAGALLFFVGLSGVQVFPRGCSAGLGCP